MPVSRRLFSILLLTGLIAAAPGAQGTGDPAPILRKVGEYVASYGEKASLIVGIEKYTQRVSTEASGMLRPREIVAEFAIVKAADGWVGFRDVVEVNGAGVSERRDRLLRLFSQSETDGSEVARIANESARYNIGPVATNMNVPTTALFFFHPSEQHRFTVTRKGTKKIDGIETVELAFAETKSPTIVRTRGGRDVPVEGTLWVVPDQGTVVRTRIRFRGFADTTTTDVQAAPARRPDVNPNTATGGKEALAASEFTDPINRRDIKSVADVEVSYAHDAALGLWLPARMSEQYEGPIKMGSLPPFQGLSTTRATYSDFKQFGTGARITVTKAP